MPNDLQPGFQVVAQKLQEAISNDDIATRLRATLEEQYEASGEYCYLVDVFGNQTTGDVVYACGGDLKKAKYTLGRADGKATCMIDFAGAIAVFPKTTYEPAQTDADVAVSESGKTTALKLIESPDWATTIKLSEANVKSDYRIKLIAPGKGSTAFYPAEVLKRDGPNVFRKDTHIYWNHPTEAEEAARPEGNADHWAGVLTSDAKYEENGPKGPGLYASAKIFADYAEKFAERAPYGGISIRAEGHGDGTVREGRPVLKEFTYAESTDFVTRAGAGGLILTEAERPIQTNEGGESDMDAAEITKLQESVRKSNQRLALYEARDFATTEIKTFRLPDATKQRLIERVTAMAPISTDGELDKTAFKAIIEAEVKDEAAYLAKLTEGRVVTGMGAPVALEPVDPKKVAEAFQEELGELGSVLGLSESGRRAFVGKVN